MGSKEGSADLLAQQNNKLEFRKSRIRNEEPIEIMLRNKILPSKESTQFLGITLDIRLNWKEYISKLRVKAKRALNTIRVVAGKKWKGYQENPKKIVQCNM